jgi:hypothetical protein
MKAIIIITIAIAATGAMLGNSAADSIESRNAQIENIINNY